ncbi:hypothetical protein A1O1_07468 [Capronia coronata CBS 617.96]|uniref:Oxidoreductase n=1 Tax=Capronia coronata CBS 617.96 TaxID=1182541 RepID=W9Y2K3_9EURO|nr:uncharacterized protein A1O1_07468 [Capronia coronata CBS 617.96]EXJ83840.1 hypothetical protein A1O1_07468 [Capronia coronata CBS 617.96]
MASEVDPDQYTKSGLFTKNYFRDVYPEIDPKKPELSQAGKVAIVTGASRGLGKAIALAFAHAGIKGLVLGARSEKALGETKAAVLAISPSTHVLAVPVDISVEESVEKFYQTISATFETVDTLVNNAGVFTDSFDVISKVSPAKWFRDFEVNVKGTFLVTAGFLKAQERKPSGVPTIINLVTFPGLVPPSLSSYFISKAAVLRFTEHIAAENPQVAVFSISPGVSPTDMTLEMFKPFAKDSPDLTGAVAVYLSATRPAYLVGRYMSVNWDVSELAERKDEIVDSGLLKFVIKQ